MLNEETIGYMLTNMHDRDLHRMPDVKQDLSEREAMQVFNELLRVMENHKCSYQCACRLAIAFSEAFLSGAVELYNQDQSLSG